MIEGLGGGWVVFGLPLAVVACGMFFATADTLILWFFFGAPAVWVIIFGLFLTFFAVRPSFWGLAISAVGVGVLGLLIRASRKDKRAENRSMAYKKQRVDEKAKTLREISPDEKYAQFPFDFMREAAQGQHGFVDAWYGSRGYGEDSSDHNFIGIRRGQKRILVCDKRGHREYDVDSLVSCEIVVDETVEQQTVRKGSVGRAVVGGLLFGGAGAVVGAISANSTTQSQQKIRQIVLRLYFDDIREPVADVAFLDRGYPVNKAEAAQEQEHAVKWHARMSTILRRLGERANSSSRNQSRE